MSNGWKSEIRIVAYLCRSTCENYLKHKYPPLLGIKRSNIVKMALFGDKNLTKVMFLDSVYML
jgi:hypothetical protein